MPKVHHVKKARKDNPVCKKGESYYWWKFAFGSKHYSLTPPKASQLTQSEFLGWLYDMQDRIGALSANTADDLQAELSEIIDEISVMQDEQEDRRSNMPDHLQDVGSGEILQERYDALDGWVSDLENIDCEDFDPDGDQPIEEWVAEKIEEIQSTDCGL